MLSNSRRMEHKEETNTQVSQPTEPPSFCSKYSVALYVAFVAVPIFGAITTGMYYFLPHPPLPHPPFFLSPAWYSIMGGWITTFIFWLILALFVSPFTTIDRADISQYNALKRRLDTLRSRCRYIAERTKTETHLPEEQDALKEAHSCEENIGKILNGYDSGLHWLWGKGYLSLWKTFHQAEEALMETEAPDTLFREALCDHSRIQNTNMSNREELLRKLTEAMDIIAPTTSSHIEKESVPNPTSSSVYSSRTTDAQPYKKARITIRETRREFNDFKDSRWEDLLTLRNKLIIATLLAVLSTCLEEHNILLSYKGERREKARRG